MRNAVFNEELECVQGMSAKIHVEPGSTPQFCKVRPVPFALCGRVERELDRLHKSGVIEPVKFAEWAAPIVPVIKSDGSVRIRGDYKVTVNRVAKVDSYALLCIDDLFASLVGGKRFSKLDLAHTYQQIPVAEEFKKFVVINTHKGLYRYNHLPFGISSAPAIFQRMLERPCKESPMSWSILTTFWWRVQLIESTFKIYRKFWHTWKRQVSGWRKTNVPLCWPLWKHQYQRMSPSCDTFLGLVNYYANFMLNQSSALAPLNQLLQKSRKWCWGSAQSKAFQAAKEALTSVMLLTHYNPDLDLVLDCDASPYGVGAVSSHRLEDGSMRPIAFASRSLNPAECRYSHLDKEGLAIIYGVKKFHQYLFGRKFQTTSHFATFSMNQCPYHPWHLLIYNGSGVVARNRCRHRESSSDVCGVSRASEVSLHLWEWPAHPWERRHIDYAGPFLGKMFFVVVDAHSKWLEIEMASSATSIRSYHCQGQGHVCYKWPPTACCVWQWRSFHQRGIQGVPGKEWNTPCEVSTLPSGIKWVGWVVRTDIQELAEEEWWGWCRATVVSVFLLLSYHSTLDDGGSTYSIVDGTSSADSSRCDAS